MKLIIVFSFFIFSLNGFPQVNSIKKLNEVKKDKEIIIKYNDTIFLISDIDIIHSYYLNKISDNYSKNFFNNTIERIIHINNCYFNDKILEINEIDNALIKKLFFYKKAVIYLKKDDDYCSIKYKRELKLFTGWFYVSLKKSNIKIYSTKIYGRY